MDDVSLKRAKILYWTFWALTLILAFFLMIYLLMFNWMMYSLLALMSCMFGSFALSRIVEYVVLRKVYKENTIDFVVPRLFQKHSKAINPNNLRGKLIWILTTLPFLLISLFVVVFDIVLFFL